MKRLRLYVRALFGFSRMETNGFLILMPLILVILFSERVYHNLVETEPLTGLDRTDSLLAWMAEQEQVARKKTSDTIAFHFFDPNAVTREELVAMGLHSSTADRLLRYRDKGGRFKKPGDVAKIYGMDSSWYQKVMPWMTFPRKDPKPSTRVATQNVGPKEDINLADTVQLQDVYGIGPALARRIVTFRDRLGGFVHIKQLSEVYGLDSIVVERVKRQFEVKPLFEPRRIYLRKVTFEELVSHPYVSRRQAQAIMAYRRQHSIDSLRQLIEIRIVDEDWLKKIQPYLILN